MMSWTNSVPTYRSLIGSSRSSETDESTILEENRQLLQLLARYIVEENNPVPEEVSLTLLGCLIPQGNALLSPSSEGMPFAELMSILSTLASAGSGIGHVQLFRTAAEWLSTCRYFGRFVVYIQVHPLLHSVVFVIKTQWVETNPSNICIFPTDICFLLPRGTTLKALIWMLGINTDVRRC
jgi:hypothetical protein